VDLQTKYEVERAKWDAHAHHTHAAHELSAADVLAPDVTFESYCAEHISMAGMADFLGDVRDRRILEYGCGLGRLTVILAKSGARVTTFDLSAASVEAARKRAELNGLADRIEFHVASGESLPFADGEFELAIGKAILHHLDPEVAARELHRVLAPGGRATFSEPLGTNPLLVFARARLPYPGKHERGADRPLTVADVATWRAPFAEFKLRPIQLLSMVERAFGFGAKFGLLRRIDAAILRRVPSAWRLCRYAVLYMTKSASADESSRKPA
jgi:SAM-dependent methyltransferase